MKKLSKIFLLAFILLINLSAVPTWTLTWDANTDKVDGYLAFMRTARQEYKMSFWKGTNTTCLVPSGLAPNTTYYFVVRAYEGELQSDDSNEVSATTKKINIFVNPF